MNGKTLISSVILFVCWITFSNTSSITRPIVFPAPVIRQRENEVLALERWVSTHSCKNTLLLGNQIKPREINQVVFQHISDDAIAETQLLAKERGEYLDGENTGRRNSHLLAIAPNASSGVILSTSPSIEPLKACAYTHRTRAGSFLVKNAHLEKLLEEKGHNNESTWSSIITKKGSVQHLPFLNEGEKAVFKTAQELDQNWVVTHAADRQPYICQGQSVNLFFPSGAPKRYVNKVHFKAWQSGLKGLYYLRTEASSQGQRRFRTKSNESHLKTTTAPSSTARATVRGVRWRPKSCLYEV